MKNNAAAQVNSTFPHYCAQITLTILILLFTILNPATCLSEEIILVADEWCPYNCTPGSERPGFVVEVARTIFEKEGIQTTYQTRPWTRAISECSEGRYQGIIGAAKPEAPTFHYPGIEQGMSTIVFLSKKGSNWKFTGMNSLKDIRIAVTQDYYYGDALNAYIEMNRHNGDRIHVTTGDQAFNQNLKLLELGRVTAILIDRDVFAHYAFMNGLNDDFVEIGEINADPIYIAFAPDAPNSEKYAAILTEGMKQLRASGELDTVLGRYGLVDWK